MALNNEFKRNDVLPSYWANRIQDFLSGADTGLRLTQKSATVVQVAPTAVDADLELAVVPIDGRWRFNSDAVERTVSGAKGTYNVYVVAEDNDVDNSPDPFSDHTEYDFELRVSKTVPEGAGIDVVRKIGEVDWSGTAIEALRQTHGAVTGPMIADGALSGSGDIEWKRDATTGAWVPTLKAITDAKLASPNNAVWRTVLEASQYITLDVAAATYWIGNLAGPIVVGNAMQSHNLPLFPFRASDYAVAGKETRLRVVASLMSNGTAPGSAIKVGATSVTDAFGAADVLQPVATEVEGLTNSVSFANNAVETQNGFGASVAAGEATRAFALEFKLASQLANNAAALVSAQLQMAHV